MAGQYQRLPLSRRRFVEAASFAGLGLLARCGRLPFDPQQPSVPPPPKVVRVGFLGSLGAAFRSSPNAEALRDGLREQGWIDGRNLALEWRFAEGEFSRLPGLAAELIALPVDVLVTMTGVEARAARTISEMVPIVFASAGDVLATQTVASLAHPGGNLTGLTNIAPDLTGKRLELLKAAVPHIARVGAIWNAVDQSMALEYGESKIAAEMLGIDLQSFSVRDEEQVVAAIEDAAAAGLDGLLVISDVFISRYRSRIVELAARQGLPTISGDPDYAAAGGLLSYGPNRVEMYRRAAVYVDKILKGAKPADLPVERPMRFNFVINLKSAQALGLTIPQHLLLQATEVIQ
jgi:putative tryptophan/tyrosine transport system substrate-binding protein